VDLAGSENASKSNTSGLRKREGGKINQRCVLLQYMLCSSALAVDNFWKTY
jgi:hypothetical protein